MTNFTARCTRRSMAAEPMRGLLKTVGHSAKSRLNYFLADLEKAWPVIREIFYDNFGKAQPNKAHEVLAAWQREGWPRAPSSAERGYLHVLITQNIDNPHSYAGSCSRSTPWTLVLGSV